MAQRQIATDRHYTAEEFFRIAGSDSSWELIEGVPTRVCAAAWTPSAISGLIVTYLNAFARPRRLGAVTISDGSFIIQRDPDTMVQPDIAFIRADRLSGKDPDRAFPGVPDLAVEVRSPSDSLVEVIRKMDRYLAAGTPLTWLVDPPRRQVHVRSQLDPVGRILDVDGWLDGEDVLPGFRLRVDAVFDVMGDLRSV